MEVRLKKYVIPMFTKAEVGNRDRVAYLANRVTRTQIETKKMMVRDVKLRKKVERMVAQKKAVSPKEPRPKSRPRIAIVPTVQVKSVRPALERSSGNLN